MKLKITLLILAVTITQKLSAYTNCEFKVKKYKPLCEDMVKKHIDINYANRLLLQKRNKEVDKVTLRLFKPRMISKHKSNEKKANNTLVKHIPKIYKHLKDYSAVYDKAEKEYGVNREIIAAILTKETWLGKIKPKHDAWVVFNSLYLKLNPDTKRNKRLIKMGKNNMLHIAQYCYKNKIEVNKCNFKASYAGAVGIPQFMPMNFWLIKGYNKKIGDLNNMDDAIMSAANYLHVKTKFKELIDFNKFSALPSLEKEWYDFSFKTKHNTYFQKKNRKEFDKTKFVDVEYMNIYIKKILRYNNSINYSLGVLRIAYELSRYKEQN
jgi:membrane-bound lytic murein transglycosylase B